METVYFWVNLLVGLLLSGFCVRSSLAFPPKHYTQHALLQRPQLTRRTVQEEQKAPAEGREQVNTVGVTCHPDSLEIVIKADMFGVGAPVNADELRLGVEHSDFCRATSSSGDEYRIIAGLLDCGTKHWVMLHVLHSNINSTFLTSSSKHIYPQMTQDSLVYTNLLIYSPVASPDGVIRMDEAVIPIECHYERFVWGFFFFEDLGNAHYSMFFCFLGSTVCPVLPLHPPGSPSCLPKLQWKPWSLT